MPVARYHDKYKWYILNVLDESNKLNSLESQEKNIKELISLGDLFNEKAI